MDNNSDKDLYNPEEPQIFKNIRCNLYEMDLFVISLFACPSFTKSINKYIEKKFNIPILSKLINSELNNNEEYIKQVFLEIINNYGSFTYYEFVFLLIYVIYQKAKILGKQYNNAYSNYIIYCLYVTYICLFFYYLSEVIHDEAEEDYGKTFKHKPLNLSLKITFDESYFMDFIEQDCNTINMENGCVVFITHTVIFRTFVNFLREAAMFSEEANNISNLFGDVIYHFDLHKYIQSNNFIHNSSHILFVLNSIHDNTPYIFKNSYTKHYIRFPKFIDIRVQKQINKKKSITKLIRYVLVVTYFTTRNLQILYGGNIIARFYKDNDEKYFRINKDGYIECNNNETITVDKTDITKNAPLFYDKCIDIEDFDAYAIMCIYHVYKWLS